MSTLQDIIPSTAIDSFLAQRDAVVERARAAHKALGEAAELFAKMPGSHNVWSRLDVNLHNRQSFTDDAGIEQYVKYVDASCWSRLFELTGLRTFMDAEARKTWEEAIEKCDVPALTHENIWNTFRAMHSARGEMFERGVVAVFRHLSWDFKTNNPVMFGKRIIMHRIVDTWYGKRKNISDCSASHDGCNKLDDLLRVLSVLDGKPEPDHRQSAWRRLHDAKWPACGVVNFDGYFSVKGFLNGNGHLTFTRPDLVDKMNLIIAKHYPGALAPAREAA